MTRYAPHELMVGAMVMQSAERFRRGQYFASR